MEAIKTFLVTGVTGFLGSVLAEKLISEGYSVIGIGQRKYGLLTEPVINHDSFTFIQNDLENLNFNELSDYRIDGILHLANRGFVDSQGNVNKEIGYEEIYNVNVKSTRKLIEFAKYKSINFLLFASSVSVFGKQPEDSVINESTCPTPLDYYGLTKYNAERLVEIELTETTTKGIIHRFPLIFGKNHLGGLVYNFYKLAASNEPIVIFGKGDAYRCPIYINDAISFILKSIEHVDDLNSFEIFSSGSSNSMKIVDIAKTVICLTSSKSEINFADRPFSLDWNMKIDVSKACDKLRHNPLSIEEGLKLYFKELGF